MTEENEPRLYANYIMGKDGNPVPIAYVYGLPWVSQALAMGDIGFDTPEEAKEWWEKNYGGKK